MPKVIQAAEFFVVGGPVQPDRLCYVEREADRCCAAALAARRHCWVLGPRAIGKSSFMARAARTLRQTGGLAALVDLAQLDARGQSADANLWSYGIAHKVAHELKLKADLAAWWREKSALSLERRLADFFWEIVLTNTTAPVTVFIDDIEQTIGLPFAGELFAALRDCDARREAEPDFKRLTFVLLGVASLRQLVPGRPFAAETIDLGDFTAEESYQLALGFGGEQAQAQALMDRVCVWTNGHPYLTQKVARGVARKGGKLEDVERVVREQLLVPRALQEEPPVQHARALLTARTPAARQARKVLRSIARGAKVAPPRDAAVLDLLRLSGVAGVDPGGALRYRNRIFKELLGARWLKTVTPIGWGRWAAAAAIFAVAALGVFWYSEYLPRPYIRTLTDPGADRAAVEDAYRRLRALPGFAARAQTLYGGTLRERSGAATTLAAALVTDARLRQLPGEGPRADALLAEFWLRRAELAEHAEQRDAALLFALRAAAADKNGRAAPALVAELVADDYRGLARTVSLPAPPAFWSFDWPRTALQSVDAERRIVRRSLAGATGEHASVPITALQLRPLTRAIEVDDDGSAGPFELRVAVRHPASDELELTIAAPSGAAETVRVGPVGAADLSEELVFSATAGSALAGLADENRRGVWRLTVIDRRAGNAGTLRGWKLTFGDDVGWPDEPELPVAIPDPERTEGVTVTAANGFAIAAPTEPGAVGSVALWNLVEERLQDDFMLPTVPQRVELNATATRLLAVAGNSVSLWNAADGVRVARLATQTEFVLPAVFSVDGGYLAIAERVEGDAPLFSLLSAIDGALLASVAGVDGAQSWLLGPGARYIALLGPQDRVRVVDPRRGAELATLQHAHEVRRVLPLADGASLVTIDSAGDIRAWSLGSNASARLLGTTADAASASVSADGRDLAYTASSGEVVVLDVATGALLHDLRLPATSPVTRTELSVDGAALVAGSGTRFRLWTLADAGVPPRADARAELGALALDREADVVAVGTRGGQLRVRTGADLGAAEALDYFGHRGAVSSVDIDAARGVAVTGGADGTVRVWDVASGGPIGMPLVRPTATDGASAANAGRDLRPTAPRVDLVAVSADGRSVAAAAGAAVQVWSAADGAPGPRLDADAAVGALAFAPSGELLAAGDAAGAVRLMPVAGGPTRAARAGAAVGALAFAPSGDLVASGDAAGFVRVWRVADAAALAMGPQLPSSIRWLGFDPTGSRLYVATDYWLHVFEVRDSGLAVVGSRLPPLRFTLGAHVGAALGERVRLVGLGERGALASIVLDAATSSDRQPIADTLGRDWVAALGLRLDDAGEPVADGQ